MEKLQYMNRDELVLSAFSKIVTGDEDQMFLAIKDLKKAIKETGNTNTSLIEFYIILIEHLTGTNKMTEMICEYFLNSVEINNINLVSAVENSKIRIEDGKKITYVDFGNNISQILRSLPLIWFKSLIYDALVEQFENFESENISIEEQMAIFKNLIGKLPEKS